MTEKSAPLAEQVKEFLTYLRKTWPNLLLVLVLSACATDVQKASEDCLVKENPAACAYVKDEQKIHSQEEIVAKIEEQLKEAKAELKKLEEEAEKSKKAWKKPNQPSTAPTPSSTPAP